MYAAIGVCLWPTTLDVCFTSTNSIQRYWPVCITQRRRLYIGEMKMHLLLSTPTVLRGMSMTFPFFGPFASAFISLYLTGQVVLEK